MLMNNAMDMAARTILFQLERSPLKSQFSDVAIAYHASNVTSNDRGF